jgi:CDP-diacylglycerol--serine O-phosphatidyltransferase
MKFRHNIPNFLTLCNLSAGVVSVTLVMRGDLVWAALFIFIAALFDFLDGTAARLLDARSELGKQLDSLADVVSFGVAPGIIIFKLLSAGCEGSCNILERMHITPYFALLIPLMSAIRLAKFNIDLRQEENFIGLPTPANALFFASIPMVLLAGQQFYPLVRLEFLADFFTNTRSLAILTVLMSYLLISDIRMFSMKFKTTGWRGNEPRYIFLVLTAALLVMFSVGGLPLSVLCYFLLSLVFQKQLR